MNLNIDKILKNKNLCIRYLGLTPDKVEIIANEVINYMPKYKVGRKKILDHKSMTILFLLYLRRYDTLERLGIMFSVSTSTTFRYIELMKNIFSSLKCIRMNSSNHDYILIDGTEISIEKPKHDSVDFYGRKKKYSIKTQVVVDKFSKEVIDITCSNGSIHDFELFKYWYIVDSGYDICEGSTIVCDAGYEGIKKYHNKSVSIKKKNKSKELDFCDKNVNKLISKFRVTNEHVIGKLKFWKIIDTKFRHTKNCNIVDKFTEISKIVYNLYNFNLN